MERILNLGDPYARKMIAELQKSINEIKVEINEIDVDVEKLTEQKDSLTIANKLTGTNENEETFELHKKIASLINRKGFLINRKESFKTRIAELRYSNLK